MKHVFKILPSIKLFPLLAAASLHCAQTEEWRGLDREGGVRLALRQNPELRVASFELTRARAKLRWAGKLTPPEVEFSANTDQFGLDENESVIELGIAQEFPLTNRLATEKDLSRVELALAETEIADARRRMIATVERSFLSTLTDQEKEKLLKEIEKLLDRFVDTLTRQAARGTVSSLDVNQARIDQQIIGRRLKRQQSETMKELSALKTLLGISDDTALSLSGNLDLPQGAPPKPDIQSARERRPDFQQAVLQKDKARAELALADTARWEDVAVRLFAEREASVDEPVGLERNTFLGVGVSIPLPLRRERATAEPNVSVDQATENSKAVALKIENEIATAHRVRNDMLSLAREAAGESLTLAEENLDAIGRAYRNGQIEILKYQRAQEQLLETRMSALEARETYHHSEVDLREATASHPGIQPLTEGK